MSTISVQEASAILHKFLQSTDAYPIEKVRAADLKVHDILYFKPTRNVICVTGCIKITDSDNEEQKFLIYTICTVNGIDRIWTTANEKFPTFKYRTIDRTKPDLVSMFHGKIDEFCMPTSCLNV